MKFRVKLAYKRAYTLIELLTIFSLIAVATSVVMPVMNNFHSHQRVSNEASNLLQNIRLGRYKSLAEQTVYRLIFSPDWTTYKLEARIFDDEDDPGTAPSASDYTDYDDPNAKWDSILDDYEYEIDPSVEILRSIDTPSCIFFWPNGTLVTQDNTASPLSETNKYPLGDNTIGFRYGEAAITVRFGYMGAISSEDYSADLDDDIANDDIIW